LKLTASGKVTGPSVIGAITPRTGVFTVTVVIGASKVADHGAILLNATTGGGYFLTRTFDGAVILEP
jgi:hypothetical protein